MVSTPEENNNKTWRGPNNPHNEWMKEARLAATGVLSHGERTASKSRKKTNTPLTDGENSPINPEPSSSKNQRTSKSSSRSGGYTNNVHGKNTNPKEQRPFFNNKNADKKKKKMGWFLKKAGPIGTIAAVLFGGGIFFYAAQSMLPAHLSALYTQATDLQYTSYNLRNARLISYMLDGGNQIKPGILSNKYTVFSPYLQKRLANNGIEVGHINADNNFEAGQAILGSKTVLRYNDKIISADSFQDEFASNANFRDAYYSAKRGRVAGFFDESSDDFFGNWPGATNRNTMSDFDPSADQDTRRMFFQDTVNSNTIGNSGNTVINTVHDETDEDGKTTTSTNGDDIEINNLEGSDSVAQAHSLVNQLAGKVSAAGGATCSMLRLASILNVVISAHQIGQSIAYFLSFMEPISQMMYGGKGASSVNEALNHLTRETTNTVDYIDEDGKLVTKTVTGSPVQSPGAQLVLGNTPSPETSFQPYSLNGITNAVWRLAALSGATTAACSLVTASSAIVSLTKYSVPGGNLAFFAIGAIAQTVNRIVFAGTVAAIISTIVPRIAKMLTSDMFETHTGIIAGEWLSQGAAAANFSLATKGSAFMPASEESVKNLNRQTTIAIAQEAEIDRLHRSPFDASSPNTFLGSIVSKFSYLSYSNPLISGTANISRVVGSSMRSLIPGASAIDQTLSYISQHTECPNLKDVVCDSYGHPIVSYDESTTDTKPDDPAYRAAIEPNLNEDGSIKDGSELSKFLIACTNRQSEWGVMDANIMNAFHVDAGSVVNNAPIANEIIDVINAGRDVANQGWGTGDTCRNTSTNPRWDSEIKYYQLFVGDMRIIQGMEGPKSAENNPVLAYEKKYREDHPLDTSFKGTLSRTTGLSMDDITFLLEYIDYSTEIANYNPSERIKFGPYTEPQKVEISFTQTRTPALAILAVSTEPIIIDRRNFAI